MGIVLSLPNVGHYFGLHHWTENVRLWRAHRAIEYGALADIDCHYAPPALRATWFALMASLMIMALVAGQLQTKYLNEVFVVERGQYGDLGGLLIVAVLLGFVIPMTAIICLD